MCEHELVNVRFDRVSRSDGALSFLSFFPHRDLFGLGSGGVSDTTSVDFRLAIELVAITWHEGGHLFTKRCARVIQESKTGMTFRPVTSLLKDTPSV